MSFGFGISDFVCCGQLAYQLYIDLKDAPGDCQGFANELLLLHQIILKTEASIIRAGNVLDDAGRATLGLCAEMCKDILFVQVAGIDKDKNTGVIDFGILDISIYHGEGWGGSSWDDRTLHFPRSRLYYDNAISSPKLTRLIYLVRQRFRERSFAKRIPKFRSAISTVTEKLTSFQILVVE